MNYAKLSGGTLIPAPRDVIYNGKRIFNPDGTLLTLLGYLPVTETPPPAAQEGYTLTCGWEEGDGEILKVWSFSPASSCEGLLDARVAALEEELEAAKILLGVIK